MPTQNGTGTLQGAGALAGNVIHTPVGAATFAGFGFMASGDYQYLVDANGNPVLDSNGHLILTGNSDAPIVVENFANPTTLAGTGGLTVSAVEIESATALLSGAGSLTAFYSGGPQTASAAFNGSVHLFSGDYSYLVDASGNPILDSNGHLILTGNSDAPIVVHAIALATLNGVGSLSGSGNVTSGGSLNGQGLLGVSAVQFDAAAAGMSIVGGMAADSQIAHPSINFLNGQGGMTANGAILKYASALFAGDVEMGGIIGKLPVQGSGECDVTGLMRADTDKRKYDSPSLNISGLLDPDGDVVYLVYPAKVWARMAKNVTELNTLIRFKAAFTRLDTGGMIDPTDVIFRVMLPDQSEVTFTYSGGDVVKDSEGLYHYDLLMPVAGIWQVKWQGTGVVQVASRDIWVTVNESDLIGSAWPAAASLSGTGLLAA